MKTTSYLYTQTHHYSSVSSPPPTTNLRRFHHHHHHNVRRRPDLTMPLRDLTIRRITSGRNNFRFNQATESFSIADNHRKMAEERKNKEVSQGQADTTALSVSKSTEEKDNESEKSTPAVPPPEKPLPGDCCGSGCVRCVWDVYYEELDEYNKLHKADPKIS